MSILEGDPRPDRPREFHEDIHGIRAAVTVISGHAQLTSRRMRRHHGIDRQVMLDTMDTMDTIERTAQRIEAHLRAIEADVP